MRFFIYNLTYRTYRKLCTFHKKPYRANGAYSSAAGDKNICMSSFYRTYVYKTERPAATIYNRTLCFCISIDYLLTFVNSSLRPCIN